WRRGSRHRRRQFRMRRPLHSSHRRCASTLGERYSPRYTAAQRWNISVRASQISVGSKADARALQQIANLVARQQLQFTLTLKEQSRGRPPQIVVHITWMTHHLADSNFHSTDNIGKRLQIEKSGLRDAVKAARRLQCSPPAPRLCKHKNSGERLPEDVLLRDLC